MNKSRDRPSFLDYFKHLQRDDSFQEARKIEKKTFSADFTRSLSWEQAQWIMKLGSGEGGQGGEPRDLKFRAKSNPYLFSRLLPHV